MVLEPLTWDIKQPFPKSFRCQPDWSRVCRMFPPCKSWCTTPLLCTLSKALATSKAMTTTCVGVSLHAQLLAQAQRGRAVGFQTTNWQQDSAGVSHVLQRHSLRVPNCACIQAYYATSVFLWGLIGPKVCAELRALFCFDLALAVCPIDACIHHRCCQDAMSPSPDYR